MANISKDKRVSAEIKRLTEVFDELTPDEAKVCEGLITQAARLRILLNDMWADICKNGDVEQFSQSPDLPPYERVRPVAQLYNTRDKLYQSVIKQLLDRIPDGKEKASDAAGVIEFMNRARSKK